MSDWQYGWPDDEFLPVTQCICGATYAPWDMVIGVGRKYPTEMPCCGRRVWFSQAIEIHEVKDGEP